MVVQVVLLLLFTFFMYVASQDNELLACEKYCGYQHTDDRQPFDELGRTPLIDEFPWVAGLIYVFEDNTQAMLCSGVVISIRYVLTAAHCLALPIEAELALVRLGEYNVTTKTDCVYQDLMNPVECSHYFEYGLEEKIIHPEYRQRTRENDIAMLRLDGEILWWKTDNVRPICLDNETTSTSSLFISGFGTSSEDGSPVEVKKKVLVMPVSIEECAKKYSQGVIKEAQLCVEDSSNNIDWTCLGDGGAPVMYYKNKPPRWYLRGLVSWGSKCGPNQTRLITRVFSYLDWINSNVIVKLVT